MASGLSSPSDGSPRRHDVSRASRLRAQEVRSFGRLLTSSAGARPSLRSSGLGLGSAWSHKEASSCSKPCRRPLKQRGSRRHRHGLMAFGESRNLPELFKLSSQLLLLRAVPEEYMGTAEFRSRPCLFHHSPHPSTHGSACLQDTRYRSSISPASDSMHHPTNRPRHIICRHLPWTNTCTDHAWASCCT